MNRGRRAENIFKEKKDRLAFIDLLKDIVDMWNARIAASAKKAEAVLITLNKKHYPMKDIKIQIPYRKK